MNVKEHYLVSMYIAYNHALYKSYSNIGYIKTRFVSLLLYFWFKVFHFFRWNTNYVETLGREESMFMNKLDETKSSSSIPSLYWFQGYIFLYLKPGYIQFITFFWVGNYFVYFMNSIFLWRFPLYEIKTCVFFDVTSLGKVIYEILHVLLTFTVNLIYWLRTIYLKKKTRFISTKTVFSPTEISIFINWAAVHHSESSRYGCCRIGIYYTWKNTAKVLNCCISLWCMLNLITRKQILVYTACDHWEDLLRAIL